MAHLMVKGYKFLIDEVDAKAVGAFTWYLQKTHRKIYARTETKLDGRRVALGLHRMITAAPKGMEVDHVNGDTLDNRRKNLRVCTHLQNMGNNRQPAGESGFKGVWKSHRGNGWVAIIKHKGKRYSLGTFKEKKQAAVAWNKAAKKFRGEFACLNKI